MMSDSTCTICNVLSNVVTANFVCELCVTVTSFNGPQDWEQQMKEAKKKLIDSWHANGGGNWKIDGKLVVDYLASSFAALQLAEQMNTNISTKRLSR